MTYFLLTGFPYVYVNFSPAPSVASTNVTAHGLPDNFARGIAAALLLIIPWPDAFKHHNNTLMDRRRTLDAIITSSHHSRVG